jgi:hypothetical protein
MLECPKSFRTLIPLVNVTVLEFGLFSNDFAPRYDMLLPLPLVNLIVFDIRFFF